MDRTIDIPVSAAKRIAFDYGYDQVIILGRKCGLDGREHCTTYGINDTHCKIAGNVGDFLKYKVMEWGRDNDQQPINNKKCRHVYIKKIPGVGNRALNKCLKCGKEIYKRGYCDNTKKA